MAQKLLVVRDPVGLEPWEKPTGIKSDVKVIGDGIPQMLQTPLIINKYFKNYSLGRHENSPLLTTEKYSPKNATEYGIALREDSIHAVWSGYRSVLFCENWQDPNMLMYRLKGVAFSSPILWNDKDGHFYAYGAQRKLNSREEKKYSDKFNKILINEGIVPVMEVIGFYDWPVRAGKNHITSSIIQTLGDTRLDELFSAIETELLWKYFKKHVLQSYYQTTYDADSENIPESLFKHLYSFYKETGRIVGSLKKLMDLSGQSWSDNATHTNAHIGNVVLYRAGEQEKLQLGLVDFDASCDSRDFTKRKLKAQQKVEVKILKETAVDDYSVGPRKLANLLIDSQMYFRELRETFAEGFEQGYEKFNAKSKLNNEIDEELFEVIKTGIRNGVESEKEPKDLERLTEDAEDKSKKMFR